MINMKNDSINWSPQTDHKTPGLGLDYGQLPGTQKQKQAYFHRGPRVFLPHVRGLSCGIQCGPGGWPSVRQKTAWGDAASFST